MALQDGHREPLVGEGVEEGLVSEGLDTGQGRAVLAVELTQEALEVLELPLLDAPFELGLVEALFILVELDFPGERPGDIVVAWGEDDARTVEAQATDECLEEAEGLLVLLLPRGLGDIAGHDAEADALLPAQLLAGLFYRLVEAPGEGLEVLALETAMGAKVEVGEVEGQERPAHGG
jgi:hypothetical protein